LWCDLLVQCAQRETPADVFTLTPSLVVTIHLTDTDRDSKAGSDFGHFHTSMREKERGRQSTGKGIFCRTRQTIYSDRGIACHSLPRRRAAVLVLQSLRCYPALTVPSPGTSLRSVLPAEPSERHSPSTGPTLRCCA